MSADLISIEEVHAITNVGGNLIPLDAGQYERLRRCLVGVR